MQFAVRTQDRKPDCKNGMANVKLQRGRGKEDDTKRQAEKSSDS